MMDEAKFRKIFIEETRENLEIIFRYLQEARSKDDHSYLISELFRLFHSIKGSSGAMGVEKMVKVSHKIENILQKLREEKRNLREDEISQIEKIAGFLEDAISEYENFGEVRSSFDNGENETPSPPAEKSLPTVEEVDENLCSLKFYIHEKEELPTARVYMVLKRVSTIEGFSHSIPSDYEIKAGKWKGNSAKLFFKPEALENIKRALEEFEFISKIEEEVRKVTPEKTDLIEYLRVPARVLDDMEKIIGDALLTEMKILHILKDLNDSEFLHLKESFSELQISLKRLREDFIDINLVSFETISSSFPRIVRETARKLGKKVNFTIKGESLRMNKGVLKELHEPLIHILRNAVDHGIEGEDERKGAGKNVEGNITLSAYKTSGWDVIEVSDDGRGMDKEKILKRAIEMKIIDEEKAKKLRDQEIFLLTCYPGFSIKSPHELTEISGRGVGMDVVNNAVMKLGGILEIESYKGKGTKMVIKIPSGTSIMQAILFKINEFTFGINLDRVIEVKKIDDEHKILERDKNFIYFPDGGKAKLIQFKSILDGEKEETFPFLIIIDTGFEHVALSAGAIIGITEIYAKPLKGLLRNLKPFFAYTISSEGEIALIIDPRFLR